MKKTLTIVFAMLLGASLSVAQATGGTPASTDKPAKKGSSTKSGKKGAKGGKKGKKNSGGTTTPPPK
jgi:hypothetical protein